MDNSIQVTFRGVSIVDSRTSTQVEEFIIHPRSKEYRKWESLTTLLCYLTCLIVPFQASFHSKSTGLWVVSYLVDVLFLIDIVLRFFVAFYHKASLITDRVLIRSQYMKGRFALDLLSILPLDIFVLVRSSHHVWYQVLSYLRLNRMLRFHRMMKFFDVREIELGSNTAVLRAIKFCAMGTILIHLFSCIWFWLGCDNVGLPNPTCSAGSWAMQLNTGIDKISLWKKYVMSLYWATATATSTGYGDIHAVNNTEKWFSIVAMLVGIALFFGLILGGMASMLTNSDSRRARYSHHLNVIRTYLADVGVDETIQDKVMAYYEYLWSTSKGVNGLGIFDDLPLTFQAELSLSINRKVLDKAPLFMGLSPGFKRMLSLVIKPMFFMPNQVIAKKGEIGHHMYYIHKGKAEIMSENNENVLLTLTEGQLFGEISLVYNLPRSTTVRAASPCVIFTLDRADMNRVIKHYPEVAEKLYTAVEHRCDLMTSTRAETELSEYDRITWNEPKQKKCIIGTLLRRALNHVILPDSTFMMVWERVHLVAVLLVCIFYPYVSSFSVSLHSLGYGESVTMTIVFALTYLLDVILLLDILIRFNLATSATTKLNEIRHNYIRTVLFWIDVISVLPLEIFAFTRPTLHERWHAVSFLRLNRLLKAFRMSSFFSELEDRLEYNIGKVRAIKFAIYIALATHLCACLWFFESCYSESCGHGSWAQHIAKLDVGLDEYIASMYWAAATMSSTGYGDIHAHDVSSQLIAVLVMFVGLLLYGYCLSSIAATLANSASPKVEFLERINAVEMFMINNNLSPELITQVHRYLTTLWNIHRGEVIPRAKRLMDDMPITLQQDVSAEEAKEVIEKVPIFMETEESFLRKLSLKTTSYLFNPGDYIVYAGDMGREMYCVRRGLVDVIDSDGLKLATLGPSGFFGEVGLIFGESRLASVQAKTYCQILMLTKDDLDEVLQYFPVVARQLGEAGASDTHLQEIQKAAIDSARTSIRRMSLTVKNKSSSVESGKLKAIAKKSSQITPIDHCELAIMKHVNVQEEYKRPYRDLSPLARIFSFFLMRKGIIPTRTWFRVWQATTIFIAGIYMITLGLQAAFLHVDIPLWILNYIFDVIFLVDIYIKFHVGFYNKNNILVTHPVMTAKNYLRTNFLLDLFCCLPTDIIVLAIWPEQYGVLRILAFARLNRSLHFYKITQFFGFMEGRLGKSENFYRQLKFAVYMGLFTHYVACGWLVLACVGQNDGSHDCDSNSWVKSLNHPIGHDAAYHRYTVTFYWASATTASVGYGDLHAFLTGEMTYALFCMVIGIVFYGYIIASVAASLANADAQRARYQERLSAIKNFLEDQNIAEHLRNRIISHYEYIWIRNRGVDPSSLFQGIPLALQADITLSVYKDMIEKVPLFQGTEIGFLKMLSMHIKPVYFLAKEYVVKKGDIGQEMYFIHAGQVEVVSEHETPIVFDTMGAGRFFGEISIVFSCPRTASIRTKTNCDVFVLTKADLDEVLNHYPLIKKKILETAEERQRMVRERAAAFAAKKKEEEDRKKNEEEEDRKRREEENKDKDSNTEDNGEDSKEKKKVEPAETTVEVEEATTEEEKIMCMKTCFTGLVEVLTGLVIMPDSKLRIITFVNCLLIFATSITITYMAAFQDHPWYLIVFSYVCEASFYLEIFFNFHLAFVDNVGDIITDHRSLVMNYVKGKFPFDLVASFPIDIFALAAPAGRKLEILSFLRLLHLLRLVRMEQFFSEYGKKLDIDVFKVRMSKFLFDVILIVHLFACGWFFIDCPDAVCWTDESWIHEQGFDNSNAITRYCTALYWVVATVTSTGYGDVHGVNDVEMIYASCVMVMGKLLFGFILGNIASTLANAEIGRVKYEEKLVAIEAHMEDQEIPPTIQYRVKNFYEFIWNTNKGVEFDSLFFDIPQCMNGELAYDLTGDIIRNIPLFSDAEVPFIRLLATKARPCQFHAKEFIVRKGDIGQEMYLIKKGLVEIVTEEHPPEIIETLEEGSFFGEKSLVLSTPRSESVRASTHVDIFVLKKEDLDEVLEYFEEVKVLVKDKVFQLYGIQLE